MNICTIMNLIFPRETLPGKIIYSHHFFYFFSPSTVPVSKCCLSICFQLFVVQVALYKLAECEPMNLLA